MSKGSAREVTEDSPPIKRSRIDLRVGSASAPNVASRVLLKYLTIWLNIMADRRVVNPPIGTSISPYFAASRRSDSKTALSATVEERFDQQMLDRVKPDLEEVSWQSSAPPDQGARETFRRKAD